MTPAELVSPLVQTITLLVVGTIVGDSVHALLHVSRRARGPLSWPGLLHRAHHQFLDEQLAFHPERFWRNVLMHQLPECAMRMTIATALAIAAGLDDNVLLAVGLLCGLELAVVVRRRGHDGFHTDARPVPPPQGGLLVDAGYHAHHHAFPDHFLAAHVQLLDRLFGRLLPLHDRVVVIVGGSRYCAELAAAAARDGARIVRADEDAVTDDTLASADVLVLGHGAVRRDSSSYEALVTRALAARQRLLPLDVWAVGDDPAWQGRFGLFADRAIVRQLRRGPMLGGVRTLAWLKRGLRRL